MLSYLSSLSLPTIEVLLTQILSKDIWKSHIKLSYYTYFYESIVNLKPTSSRMIDAIHLFPQSSRHFACPSIILSYFSKNHRCSLLICNCIRLLLHCSDLQGHLMTPLQILLVYCRNHPSLLTRVPTPQLHQAKMVFAD